MATYIISRLLAVSGGQSGRKIFRVSDFFRFFSACFLSRWPKSRVYVTNARCSSQRTSRLLGGADQSEARLLGQGAGLFYITQCQCGNGHDVQDLHTIVGHLHNSLGFSSRATAYLLLAQSQFK